MSALLRIADSSRTSWGVRKVPSPDKCAPALQLSLDGPRRNDPRYPGAEEAMNAWFVVMNAWFVIMIILLGIGALTLHRYDVWRVLIWIAFGWFVLGALLLVTGRAPVRLDRDDIGRMKISRALIWAFRVAL